MNPLLQAAIGSILRAGLAGVAGWFVSRGVWTADAANDYLTAAVLGLLTLGWSVWTHYKDRIRFLTALESPAGSTEARVNASIKAGTGATLTVILPLLLALGVTSCAGTLRDRVRTSALVSGELVLTLDGEEYALYTAGTYDKAAHLKIGDTIDVAILAVRAYERAARAWPDETPAMPQTVKEAQAAAVAALDAVSHVLDGVPHTESIQKILAAVRARVSG